MNKVFLPIVQKNYKPIPLGTAAHPDFFSDMYKKTLLANFSTVTPECGGCYYYVYGEEFGYGWGQMDGLYKFALENNLNIHYAHLRWWYKDQPPDIFMWIYEAMSRYNLIRDWTVCNEAYWYDLETYPFIEDSFEYAIKLRESGVVNKNARLFYNGLFLQKYEQDKVKEFITNGLVEGVGIQMHHNLNSSFDIYIDFLQWLKYYKIPWRVSEMDVEIPDTSEYCLTNQAEQYKTAANLLRSYNGEDLGVWGVCDTYSWLQDHPLLFDKDYNPKPAFFAINK